MYSTYHRAFHATCIRTDNQKEGGSGIISSVGNSGGWMLEKKRLSPKLAYPRDLVALGVSSVNPPPKKDLSYFAIFCRRRDIYRSRRTGRWRFLFRRKNYQFFKKRGQINNSEQLDAFDKLLIFLLKYIFKHLISRAISSMFDV